MSYWSSVLPLIARNRFRPGAREPRSASCTEIGSDHVLLCHMCYDLWMTIHYKMMKAFEFWIHATKFDVLLLKDNLMGLNGNLISKLVRHDCQFEERRILNSCLRRNTSILVSTHLHYSLYIHLIRTLFSSLLARKRQDILSWTRYDRIIKHPSLLWSTPLVLTCTPLAEPARLCLRLCQV